MGHALAAVNGDDGCSQGLAMRQMATSAIVVMRFFFADAPARLIDKVTSRRKMPRYGVGTQIKFRLTSCLPANVPTFGNCSETLFCRSKSLCLFGRSERIRTSDPIVPNDVRYQAALHSDVAALNAGEAAL
jgi:hypothetical protein